MRISHTAKVMFSKFVSFCSQGKGGGVSRKVHYEHILATKVLMPMGGVRGVSGKVHYEHIFATKVLMPVGGCWVSGKVHFEHILGTKVPMPCLGGGGVGCPGKCTIQVMSQEMSSSLLTSARYAIDIRIAFLLFYQFVNVTYCV